MFALYIVGLLSICYLCWWMRDRLTIERVSNKSVFITGCDTGFGYLAAKILDQHGFLVFAGCLTESGAQQLKKETSERLITVGLDVTNSNSIDNATEQIRSAVGDRGLWGLINNSGISGILCPTDWLKIEHFRTPIEVNLLGSIEVTLKSLPLLKQARGRVVNISSVLGRLALGGGGYYPSKFGMEAFNDSLRRDMRSFGINVSCIEPGIFKTKLIDCSKHRAERRTVWDSLSAEVQRQYGEDYLKQMDDKKDEMVKRLLNTDLSLVVWCMQHALTAKYPRTRYSVGIDAKLLWIPLTYLPTFVADYLLTRGTGKMADPNAISLEKERQQ